MDNPPQFGSIATTTPQIVKSPPSMAISQLDSDIRNRFKKRTGELSAFLLQYIMMEENRIKLLAARGQQSETYLHYLLANHDVDMATALAQTCNDFARTTVAEPIMDYMRHVDGHGNDVWHYLAESLANENDDEATGDSAGLAIAKILIQMDIDFCRKNEDDISALARLLFPDVKWSSVNAMLRAKHLSLAEIEASFADRISKNTAILHNVMVGIFESDLLENEATLLKQMLGEILSPRAEAAARTSMIAACFNYVGGKRSETVFMKALQAKEREAVEMMLKLAERGSEDATRTLSASDTQAARAQRQFLLYQYLGKRDKIYQGPLHKAVIANNPGFITPLISLFRQENLTIAGKVNQNIGGMGGMGGTHSGSQFQRSHGHSHPQLNARTQSNQAGDWHHTRERLMVDQSSPAPANPFMSLLLQQDAFGNTVFHLAVLHNREDCLRKLLSGLSNADSGAILIDIPNRYNLTVADLLSQKIVHGKLSTEIRERRINIELAQGIMQSVKKIDARLHDYLRGIIAQIDETIRRSKAKPQPNFDLARIPTIRPG